jgi:hypothetical protein
VYIYVCVYIYIYIYMSACVFMLGIDYLEKYRRGNENNINVILVVTVCGNMDSTELLYSWQSFWI